jgi:hypothetical protein
VTPTSVASSLTCGGEWRAKHDSRYASAAAASGSGRDDDAKRI